MATTEPILDGKEEGVKSKEGKSRRPEVNSAGKTSRKHSSPAELDETPSRRLINKWITTTSESGRTQTPHHSFPILYQHGEFSLYYPEFIQLPWEHLWESATPREQ